MSKLALENRIVTDPEILVGKPVIKGTRIAVELVLEYLAHTPDLGELFADYPELTREDVQAVLAYAQEAVVRQQQPAKPKRGATRAAHASLMAVTLQSKCGRAARTHAAK